ncbi:MAG: rRNA pseudouridine synthase [Spirochaetaceae bacterium]|jgi:23S rRNA pseudouridine2605 synthase|nr:rRNA pseudouridine synthase [Spirochaetaceae bacterium]
MTERLQAFLAHAGIASRRASEQLIAEGRVTVNGGTVTEPGTKVAETDAVCVDGVPVRRETVMRYLALHKPSGYICASSDPQGRPLALNLLPAGISERIYNIGRLDYESSGLILFTNDGSFAAKTGHPRANIEKEYVVKTTRAIPDDLPASFVQGLTIVRETGEKTGEPAFFRAKSAKRLAPNSLSITLIEGRNREIRRVFSRFHLHIVSLQRVRIGPVRLAGLAEGATRPLTPNEKSALEKTITPALRNT